MDSLLLICGENTKFDAEKVQRDLQEIPGVSNLRTGEFVGAVLDCDYEYHDSRTILHLSDDLQRISMRPLNDASLQMALELQKREERPLLVFNQAGDFDFNIVDVATLEEFREKVRAAYETAAA